MEPALRGNPADHEMARSLARKPHAGLGKAEADRVGLNARRLLLRLARSGQDADRG
jgi:hypothetical protein